MISPVNLYDYMDQVIYIRINHPLLRVLFSHEGIVHINVTLKVKTVLMFLLWITSIAVQPETTDAVTTLQKPLSLLFSFYKLSKNERK